MSAPAPLGTVVLNEKAEVAAESFPTKNVEAEQTMQHNLASDAPAPAIPADTQGTAVIPLAAQAPTSKPAEETKVIPLAAQAPTSKPAEETKVIPLAAQAPTSKPAEEKPKEEGAPENPELDFPDVHGEAEKIDVFGDNDLP